MSNQPWSLFKAEEHLASRAISCVGVSKHLPSKGLWCSRSPWPRSCSTISIQGAHQMTPTFTLSDVCKILEGEKYLT